jgi:hypothetical protein
VKKGLLIGLGVLGALALLGSSSKAAVSQVPPPPPPPKPKPPGVRVDIGPATIEKVQIPEGWIAAPPGEIPAGTVAQMQALHDPPGTKYPFQANGKNYLGLVLQDGSVAILEEG